MFDPRRAAALLLFTTVLASPPAFADPEASVDAPSAGVTGRPDPVGGLFRLGGGGGVSGIRFEVGGGLQDSRGFVHGTWEAGRMLSLYAYQMVSLDGGAVLPTPKASVAPFVGGRIGVGGGFGFLGAPLLVRPTVQLGVLLRAPGSKHGVRLALDAGIVHAAQVGHLGYEPLAIRPAVQLQVAWVVGRRPPR